MLHHWVLWKTIVLLQLFDGGEGGSRIIKSFLRPRWRKSGITYPTFDNPLNHLFPSDMLYDRK
jgi:hypothetical protein